MAGSGAKAEVAYGVGSRGSDTTLRVIATPGFADYALLDSGDGRKLERFGRFTIERPESQALWRPALEPGAWLRADAAFKSAGADEDSEGGRWRTNTAVPETWPVRVRDTTVLCRLTRFRHLGLFPEQLPGKWANYLLASRATTIYGGTSEVQLNIIAERLLGLPRDP